MPKIALISDVHANLTALTAVMKKLDEAKPDVWVCLGDIVGYGPNPSECIDVIRERGMICVLGNHDAGVCGKMPLKHFRSPNRRLIEMSQEMISKEQKSWLSNLPLTINSMESDFLAAHASPERPEEWQYLESAFKVRELLPTIDQQFCFIGHTHRSAFVSDTIGLTELKKGHKYLINPGSVGQPRDGDARASCGILDTDELSYKNIRVPFDVAYVVAQLEELGFSPRAAAHMMRYS